MENENSTSSIYGFLEEENVQAYFADLNIKLLSGRHIQMEDYNLYSLLEDLFDEFKIYYEQLYKLNLAREAVDNSRYYYLEFFDHSKGKLSDPSRQRALTEWQTVVGLMLLDMYYAKYFDDPKLIKWSDIKYEIEAGDKREKYQLLFFETTRSGFTKNEWAEIEKKFRNTIQSFHELGWVNKLSGQGDELVFEVKTAIHRMAKLYSHELENFEEFISLFKTSIQQ